MTKIIPKEKSQSKHKIISKLVNPQSKSRDHLSKVCNYHELNKNWISILFKQKRKKKEKNTDLVALFISYGI